MRRAAEEVAGVEAARVTDLHPVTAAVAAVLAWSLGSARARTDRPAPRAGARSPSSGPASEPGRMRRGAEGAVRRHRGAARTRAGRRRWPRPSAPACIGLAAGLVAGRCSSCCRWSRSRWRWPSSTGGPGCCRRGDRADVPSSRSCSLVRWRLHPATPTTWSARAGDGWSPVLGSSCSGSSTRGGGVRRRPAVRRPRARAGLPRLERAGRRDLRRLPPRRRPRRRCCRCCKVVDRTGYPFGPFMLLGALVGVVVGQSIIGAIYS